MRQCPKCRRYFENSQTTCPECSTTEERVQLLRNETEDPGLSSEDADEGAIDG